MAEEIVYDRLQWAGEEYQTSEYSREIYEIADAETMSEYWLFFHTFDVEMAIDDLKEIYKLHLRYDSIQARI